MPRTRAWVRYIEQKYGVVLRQHECRLALDRLTATQAEIERVKYDLVRHEGFRVGEPILAYRGRHGRCFIVDGHTRARVLWDLGETQVPARLCTSDEPDVDAELERIASAAGGGRQMTIQDVPVVDRLGVGSDAWYARRAELLARWKAESAGRDGGATDG
jgi:hypothetical protein